MKSRIALLSSCAFIAGVFTTPTSAVAQDADVSGEEVAETEENTIVVVGRLKEESLQDLPASVTAVAGEELQTKGLLDIELLSTQVQNFSYTTNVGPSDNLFIRGMGTVGSGPQFEPAVGQQINGVAFTRSRIGRAGLLDVSQVEVLRGPQGAVTGKNTSLGLVNIVPNKPSAFFEGSVAASYNFEDNEGYEIEGFVTGPITDGIRARVAARFTDQDGHIDNLAPNAATSTAQTREDFTVRGILDFDIGSRGNIELMGQYVDAQRDGKPREIVNCNDPAAAFAAIGDDCQLNRTHTNVAIFDGQVVPERLNIELYLLTGTINYDITDAITLTSITSYLDSDITDAVDTDVSVRERFFLHNAETLTQFAQEIRFYGELSPGLDFIFGGLYSEYDLDAVQASDYNFNAVRRRTQISQQRNEGYSIFGELTWELSDTITLTGGLRYIEEQREARSGQVQTDLYTFNNELGDCTGSGLTGCTFFPDFPGFSAGTVLAGNTANFGGINGIPNIASGPFFSVTDDDITWNVTGQWQASADTMFFVTAATGFKAGAFQLTGVPDDLAVAAATFSIEPETSINYEFGGRHEFELGRGDVRFNWTLYRTEVENQQISSLDPLSVSQLITNADEARSQGVEINSSISVDNMRVGIDFAYTDAEYTDFATGTCYSGQTVQAAPAAGFFLPGELASGQCGPTLLGTDLNGNNIIGNAQNRTGTTLVQAPEIQVNVNIQNDFFIGDSLVLTPFFEVLHVGDHFADTELAPDSAVDGYVQLNARLTLADVDERWNLALVGQNLTDEVHFQFFNETGQLNSNGIGGGDFAFPNVGRTIALRARFNF